MKRYLADRNCLNIIRLIIILTAAALVIAANYYLYSMPVVMWIIIGISAAAGIFFSSVYLPLYFRCAGYYINSDKIIKKTGVFIKTNQCMRTDSVQYIQSIKTPFSKVTGFNFIIFNAFGGKLILPFLSRRDMDEITAFIFDKINNR